MPSFLERNLSSPSPELAHSTGNLNFGTKNDICARFQNVPINLNSQRTNDLQRSTSSTPKFQNSRIPERHTLMESAIPKPRPKPSLSTYNLRLKPYTSLPHSRLFSPTQVPIIKRFTHVRVREPRPSARVCI